MFWDKKKQIEEAFMRGYVAGVEKGITMGPALTEKIIKSIRNRAIDETLQRLANGNKIPQKP